MILCFSDKKVSSFANCPNLSNVVWNWSHLFLADWFLYFYWRGNTRDKEIRLTETHEDVGHGHVDDVHVGGGLHVLPRQHHHHHQQVAEDTDLQTENNFLLPTSEISSCSPWIWGRSPDWTAPGWGKWRLELGTPPDRHIWNYSLDIVNKFRTIISHSEIQFQSYDMW